MKNAEIMLIIKLFLQVQQNVDLVKKWILYALYIFDKEIRYLPIQLRDPAENGINANGERSFDVKELLANRSGSNFSGLGKTFAS
jgi:hypothetical protein